jgi:hypothetical protein
VSMSRYPPLTADLTAAAGFFQLAIEYPKSKRGRLDAIVQLVHGAFIVIGTWMGASAAKSGTCVPGPFFVGYGSHPFNSFAGLSELIG